MGKKRRGCIMKKISLTLINGLIIAMLGVGLLSSPSSVNAQAGIPAGATITSATFSIYSSSPINQTVNVHRITAAWTEPGVTWANFAASYDTTIAATLPISPTGWQSTDITGLVQDWVDGTDPNYGILLEQDRTQFTTYNSSEWSDPTLRPKLEICYTAAGISNTCITIQRLGADHTDVLDSYIKDLDPNGNFGYDVNLYTGLLGGYEKQTLIRFDFTLLTPAVSIVKYTNGQLANDPNGADVPVINPGDTVTWTYKVTNTGQVAVARANVSVTDDQTGVTPAFDHEISGNGNTVFDPGEVWVYVASGIAVDLNNPPADVTVVPGVCTHGQTQPPRNAYVNQGTASIPGATSTAKSSYCNPPAPAISIVKYTNGQVADDPNGADVPFINPGDTVTWTYKVTNTGQVAVARANVSVTDDQTGVTPAFDHEISGNGNTVFDPGEVWLYKATGTAVNLSAPPMGVNVIQGVCTLNGTRPPSTAYINHGTASIPGATSTAQSSYCNPIFKIYFPAAMRQTEVIVEWHAAVGFEDLPLAGGANDYDYNDWIADINGYASFDPANHGLREITFSFMPHARGATYDHTFHILIPHGTFGSNGTAVVTIMDQNNQAISSQTFAFQASADNDFVIFPNTSDVFPDLANTYESKPFMPPQRFASLDITFTNPAPFDFSIYNFGTSHGEGLFFDPYLFVHNTGDTIHRGDIRMLTVPENTYLWPEEQIRIDKAYPNVTFVPGNPPTITFPNNWWLTYNHCVYDGVPCVLTKAPNVGTVTPGTPSVSPSVTPTVTPP
jgi:LruC domain-containing protein